MSVALLEEDIILPLKYISRCTLKLKAFWGQKKTGSCEHVEQHE